MTEQFLSLEQERAELETAFEEKFSERNSSFKKRCAAAALALTGLAIYLTTKGDVAPDGAFAAGGAIAFGARSAMGITTGRSFLYNQYMLTYGSEKMQAHIQERAANTPSPQVEPYPPTLL